MSWSERRLFLGGLAALAGCGFAPVYGPGGTGRALDRSVLVTAPGGSNAFTLGQELEDRFGPPNAPRYELTFELDTRSERVAITQAQDTNRYNIVGVSRYALTATDTGEIRVSGEVSSFAGYSAAGTTVATKAAERDAYDRLMVILADKITADLLTASLGPPL